MIGGIVLKAPGWGGGKRRRFVFLDRTSCYHVMSRVAGGDLLFGDVEKEAFRKLMRRMERFSGVEALTYAVMGNHFHLLLRVPERAKFLRSFEKGTRLEREERLIDHLKLLYSRAYLTQLKAELAVMTEKGMDALYEKTVQGYLGRLCSLEHFMNELKERFSRWFNKRHGRRGNYGARQLASQCHERVHPGEIDPEFWRGVTHHMAIKSKLTDVEEQQLLLYVMAAHAKVHGLNPEH